MTIREAKENGMYADIEVSDIEDIDGFMDMNINDFPHAEMNGCEFYLYLQKDYPAWKAYEGYTEEEKNTVRKDALELYDYSEQDKFLVFFK